MTGLGALEKIRDCVSWCAYDGKEVGMYESSFKIIEKELILLNALRNKLNCKIETKEYKDEASNSYRISTLLTYELKEQWNEKEIECLKEFLLKLSGISKELKALEIIKTKKVAIKYVCGEPCLTPQTFLTEEEYNLLIEVLLK